LNQVYSKIHKYDNENIHFSKKYNCSFEEFNHKIDLMNDKENFDWEDDLMDWKFAFENLKYWQKKAKEIQTR
ncbi:hypothetical protein HZA55_03350, partial [Candidatus Poribacteria bacterium]|nr:hypothetical protein [Candidatus Poribacteria bacterium]